MIENNEAPLLPDLPHITNDLFQEQLTDTFSKDFHSAGGNTESTGRLIKDFVHGASLERNVEPKNWLVTQFRKHADLWDNDESLVRDADDIVNTIHHQQELKASLAASLHKGKTRNNWIGKELERSAKNHGVINVGDYARGIDDALTQANELMKATITRNDGQFSQARNLDGFIAEVHHVNTFNVNAKAAGSSARAELVVK
ncbi:hypothetical protein, partial [Shimwellia blattae]|uniref:Uncharacterized protein n=1 Tax=Shimwellia blattae (strain ATCC 29907 / DSM 4481 / JCM 1650 / NBRC 105725 / CDC 9005-74) TaxID=630626 RepID=I2B8V3_SHIBC